MEISFGKQKKKTKPPKKQWRKLVSLEKYCEFKDIKQEYLLISNFLTSIINEKVREKLIRKKLPNPKLTMDLLTQDSYEKRHKQSTKPTELVKEKKKSQYKKSKINTE